MWFRRALYTHSNLLGKIRCKYPPWMVTSSSSSSSPFYSDNPTKKGKAAPLQERRMRDRVRIWAKGGEGGNGCWSYRRGRNDRYGKPDVEMLDVDKYETCGNLQLLVHAASVCSIGFSLSLLKITLSISPRTEVQVNQKDMDSWLHLAVS